MVQPLVPRLGDGALNDAFQIIIFHGGEDTMPPPVNVRVQLTLRSRGDEVMPNSLSMLRVKFMDSKRGVVR